MFENKQEILKALLTILFQPLISSRICFGHAKITVEALGSWFKWLAPLMHAYQIGGHWGGRGVFAQSHAIFTEKTKEREFVKISGWWLSDKTLDVGSRLKIFKKLQFVRDSEFEWKIIVNKN